MHARFRADDGAGFHWLSWQDDANSVLSFLRKDGDDHAVVVPSFTSWMDQAWSIVLKLPPLGGLVLVPAPRAG